MDAPANGFKLDVNFHPPSLNSAFHFIFRLCRWRSANANGTQLSFANRWTVNHANSLPWKSWSHSSTKNWRPKNFYIFSVFRQLWDLVVNICWTKRQKQNRQQARALESMHCPKISWTSVHKRLKTRSEFLIHPHYFVLSQSIAHPLCGINVAPPTLNEMAAQIWSPKRC